jgi:hypothetical protein
MLPDTIIYVTFHQPVAVGEARGVAWSGVFWFNLSQNLRKSTGS